MNTVWASFDLLAFYLAIVVQCRLIAGRATISLGGLSAFFVYGCCGASVLSLLLQQIPIPFFDAATNARGVAMSPAAWWIAPAIEEFAKALPVLVFAFATSAWRKLSIADLVLIGCASGAGFGFVESNLAQLSHFPPPGAEHFLLFGYRSVGGGAAHTATYYFAGHAVTPALVALVAGVGLRLAGRGRVYAAFLCAIAFAIVSFDHGVYNWKLLHPALGGTFRSAGAIVETLHWLTFHGLVEVWILAGGLILAQIIEGRACAKVVGRRADMVLPDEYRTWVVNEWYVAARNARLGCSAFDRTLAFFRHRRAFAIAALEATRNPAIRTLAQHALLFEQQVIQERTLLLVPPHGVWLAPRQTWWRNLASLVWRTRFALAFAVLLIPFFMVEVSALPPWLRNVLFGDAFAKAAVVAGLGVASWRIFAFFGDSKPDPVATDGAALATHYGRVLLLISAFSSGILPVVAIFSGWKGLAPGAAYFSGYFALWLARGGNLYSALGLTAIGSAIEADPENTGGALRDEIEAGNAKIRRLERQYQNKITRCLPGSGGTPAVFDSGELRSLIAELDEERKTQGRRALCLDICERGAREARTGNLGMAVEAAIDEFERLRQEFDAILESEWQKIEALEQGFDHYLDLIGREIADCGEANATLAGSPRDVAYPEESSGSAFSNNELAGHAKSTGEAASPPAEPIPEEAAGAVESPSETYPLRVDAIHIPFVPTDEDVLLEMTLELSEEPPSAKAEQPLTNTNVEVVTEAAEFSATFETDVSYTEPVPDTARDVSAKDELLLDSVFEPSEELQFNRAEPPPDDPLPETSAADETEATEPPASVVADARTDEPPAAAQAVSSLDEAPFGITFEPDGETPSATAGTLLEITGSGQEFPTNAQEESEPEGARAKEETALVPPLPQPSRSPYVAPPQAELDRLNAILGAELSAALAENASRAPANLPLGVNAPGWVFGDSVEQPQHLPVAGQTYHEEPKPPRPLAKFDLKSSDAGDWYALLSGFVDLHADTPGTAHLASIQEFPDPFEPGLSRIEDWTRIAAYNPVSAELKPSTPPQAELDRLNAILGAELSAALAEDASRASTNLLLGVNAPGWVFGDSAEEPQHLPVTAYTDHVEPEPPRPLVPFDLKSSDTEDWYTYLSSFVDLHADTPSTAHRDRVQELPDPFEPGLSRVEDRTRIAAYHPVSAAPKPSAPPPAEPGLPRVEDKSVITAYHPVSAAPKPSTPPPAEPGLPRAEDKSVITAYHPVPAEPKPSTPPPAEPGLPRAEDKSVITAYHLVSAALKPSTPQPAEPGLPRVEDKSVITAYHPVSAKLKPSTPPPAEPGLPRVEDKSVITAYHPVPAEPKPSAPPPALSEEPEKDRAETRAAVIRAIETSQVKVDVPPQTQVGRRRTEGGDTGLTLDDIASMDIAGGLIPRLPNASSQKGLVGRILDRSLGRGKFVRPAQEKAASPSLPQKSTTGFRAAKFYAGANPLSAGKDVCDRTPIPAKPASERPRVMAPRPQAEGTCIRSAKFYNSAEGSRGADRGSGPDAGTSGLPSQRAQSNATSLRPVKFYHGTNPMAGDEGDRTAVAASMAAPAMVRSALGDALATYFALTGEEPPPMQTLETGEFMQALESGRLETEHRSAQPWSYSGIPMRGDVVIRLKKSAARHIEFIPSNVTFGQTPRYFPRRIGVGTAQTYIPVEHLEYFDASAREWLPIKQ